MTAAMVDAGVSTGSVCTRRGGWLRYSARIRIARTARSCALRCYWGCSSIQRAEAYLELTVFEDGEPPRRMKVCTGCHYWHATAAEVAEVHGEGERVDCR